MQINISARHGQISEATREKITTKVGKLSRFFERLTAIEVTVDLEHPDAPRVELLVSAEHKHDFVATDRGDNMLAAVETTVQKMEQQLRKYKEKLQDHRFTPTGQLAAEVQANLDDGVDEPGADGPEAEEP